MYKLFNSLKVGVLLQGPDSEILFSNRAALQILGLTGNALEGRLSFHPGREVIQEDGSVFPVSSQPVPTAIRTKKAVENIVMGVRQPETNDRIWLLVNAEPILDDQGTVKEVICSFSDITERKAAGDKLTSLYRHLEKRAFDLASSNADLERFVYAATHDLQEPLRLISSFMQLLKKKYEKQLDEQAGEYIHYAVEGARRMKKLILDLLEYSKFGANRQEFVPTDLNALLEQVSRTFSGPLKKNQAQLCIGKLPVIQTDSGLMLQLFENLVDNALKYRRDCSPVIEIGCQEEGDQYLFHVSDNGIGIGPDYTEKIFMLFQRLHAGNGSHGGTGVGLAICKKIVGLHRGRIWVNSEPGSGSTFYFTIPKTEHVWR